MTPDSGAIRSMVIVERATTVHFRSRIFTVRVFAYCWDRSPVSEGVHQRLLHRTASRGRPVFSCPPRVAFALAAARRESRLPRWTRGCIGVKPAACPTRPRVLCPRSAPRSRSTVGP